MSLSTSFFKVSFSTINEASQVKSSLVVRVQVDVDDDEDDKLVVVLVGVITLG
jgi:hypothetical protein